MKKLLILLLTLLFLLPIVSLADSIEPPVEEESYEEYVPPSEPEVENVTHRVTITWILDTTFSETQPPFSGTVIGSTSFDAAEGDVIEL